MKVLLALFSVVSLALAQDDRICPLTSFLAADHEKYISEAEELGYYVDGEIDEAAIVADLGQEIYDTCRSLADEVTEDNVKEEVAEFYNLDAGGSSSGGPCWDDPEVIANAQDVIFFDCVGLNGDGEGGTGGCPFVNKVEADSASVVEEAIEQGWFDETANTPDVDAIVADVGQEAFDVCHEEAELITEDNVADFMRDYYGLPENGSDGGGPCWTDNEDIVMESKFLVLYDCLFDVLEAMTTTTASS